ncbi:MAG: adenylosuccinate synthetase, partial [Burkholderiaceae bacterium]
TKLDVLDGLKEIKLCVGYDSPDGRLDVLPAGADSVAQCKPIYESWPGWEGSTAGIKSWDDLPIEAQRYLTRLSEVTGAGISMISTGPERDETILLDHPFAG